MKPLWASLLLLPLASSLFVPPPAAANELPDPFIACGTLYQSGAVTVTTEGELLEETTVTIRSTHGPFLVLYALECVKRSMSSYRADEPGIRKADGETIATVVFRCLPERRDRTRAGFCG